METKKYNFDPRKSLGGLGGGRKVYDRTTWEGEQESQPNVKPVDSNADIRHPFADLAAIQTDPVFVERAGVGYKNLSLAAHLAMGGKLEG